MTQKSSFDDVRRVTGNIQYIATNGRIREEIEQRPDGTHALLPHDLYEALRKLAVATISNRSNCYSREMMDAQDRLADFGDLPGGSDAD